MFSEDVFDGAVVKGVVINTGVYFFSRLLRLFVSFDDLLVSQVNEVLFVLGTVFEVDEPESDTADKEQDDNGED